MIRTLRELYDAATSIYLPSPPLRVRARLLGQIQYRNWKYVRTFTDLITAPCS